ncbi:MAG TPA: glycosyl hydrolase [Candidatus Acidoferrum sp.]|nr:glycosyl hydrolase [Candidatus Acidoferrum sp.]
MAKATKTHARRSVFLCLLSTLVLAAIVFVTGCASSGTSGNNTGSPGGNGGTGSGGSNPSPANKSAKRGIAYDLASPADMAALAPGVSWWYNWSPSPNASVPSDYRTQYNMDFYPMLWNGTFNSANVVAFLKANPNIKYILVLNEPNITSQADVTPQHAAEIWPQYEAVAQQTGVQIVGPAMTWGTMSGYEDPIAWLDAFYSAYRSANNGNDPEIDYLAFHWYDYGLSDQLDRLGKYNKSFWVTEFANWHSQDDGAQIDTLAKQEAQMTDMVATCESRVDVFRYAWFTGRISPDPHYTSLLAADGQLTGLGQLYITLPYSQ